MRAADMKFADGTAITKASQREVYESLLPLKTAQVLELGCGKAEITRAIAQAFPGAHITGLEVDRIQHEKNLKLTPLPNVRFGEGGAQAIDLPDASIDVVLMFKSLHHVPTDLLDHTLSEIRRVLKPGGLAYFEEPVYEGEYNEIMRVFHDEGVVRKAAFATLQRAVESGAMELVAEKFYMVPKGYRDFAQFEEQVRGTTHTEHHLRNEQLAAVREKFKRLMTPEGVTFQLPMRVDLLRRPSA